MNMKTTFSVFFSSYKGKLKHFSVRLY